MRRRLGVLLVPALLAGALIAPSAAEAKHECRVAGSKTVLDTQYTRVLSKRVTTGGKRATVAFGCAYRIGRAFPLLSARELRTLPRGATLAFGNIRANIRYVGYSVRVCLRGACDAFVSGMDLLNGRRVTSPSSLRRVRPRSLDVTDLELTVTGSLAWIGRHEPRSRSAETINEVYALDTAGLRRLDAGAGIDPDSLVLPDPSLAEWSKDGTRRSADIF